jgi:paraquat-inducible protein A
VWEIALRSIEERPHLASEGFPGWRFGMNRSALLCDEVTHAQSWPPRDHLKVTDSTIITVGSMKPDHCEQMRIDMLGQIPLVQDSGHVANEDYNQALSDRSLIACPHCDMLQRLPDLAAAASVRCPQCDEELWRRREDWLNRTLAMASAATILYIMANTVPMLGLSILGREASTTVTGGALHLWRNHQQIVSLLVFFTAVVAPAVQIGLTLAIVLGARRQPIPRWTGALLRYYATSQTWSMIEVMMLGVLVALVKIADYAKVIPGTALFVLGGLIVVLAAMQASFEPHEVWEEIEWARSGERRALRKIE